MGNAVKDQPQLVNLSPINHGASIDPQRIAARLSEALKAAHISQATLARATGISKSTISRYLSEGDMWLSELVKVCRALNVDPVDLIVGNAPAAIESRAVVNSLSAFSPAEQYYVRSVLEQLAELRAATVDTVLSAVRSPIVRTVAAVALSAVVAADASVARPTARQQADAAVTADWWPGVR